MTSRIRSRSKYQNMWTKQYDWIAPVDNDIYSAHCKICSTTFSVESMGKQALRSHSEGKKHQENVRNALKTSSIVTFFKRSPCPAVLTQLSTSPTLSNTTETTSTTCLDIISPSPLAHQPSTSTSQTQQSPLLPKANLPMKQSSFAETYSLMESVAKAEILWCLHCVIHHFSLRSGESSCDLFKIMFPTCETAKNMKLHKTKISYTIVYGLAPYFENHLLKTLQKCPELVIGFDESLNKVAQKQQMDITVKFWDSFREEVSTRYLTSMFLEHCTAEHLLNGLKKAVGSLDHNKILQVSMDGPNVNLKLLRLLNEERNLNKENPILLDIGTCGLHTIHCAFKSGMKGTTWEIIEFLRAIFNLFKDVPSRRGDYTRASGSSVFPLKFCAVRWIENSVVANRAIKILPNIKKYVNEMENCKTEPSCKSYQIIKEALNDKLLLAKLTFFESIAEELVPFLSEFQTSAPMTPFLYNYLTNLVKSFLKRFVKEGVLNLTDVTKIDLSRNTNLILPRHIDLGYATRLALKRCSEKKLVNDLAVVQFKQQCRTCLQLLAKKILERSPLKYKLTKAISCFDPSVAGTSSGANRLKNLLEMMVEGNLVTGSLANRIEQEYRLLCSKERLNNQMAGYHRSEMRLDHFWMHILGSNREYDALKTFLKKIIILSHGTSDIERGFSINKECLVENQHEASLKAQRIIFDAVRVAGGLANIVVDTPMIHAAKNAHSRYKEALERSRCEENQKRKEIEEKRKIKQVELELRKKKTEANGES